jgi:signal transduction histidine kinase
MEKISAAMQNRLTPEDADSLLHFLPATLNGKKYALPYVYSYDTQNGNLTITGFIPDNEYLERVLFPTLLHSDIFSGPDIFQGELLEKNFAFDITRLGTPVASTRLDYRKDELASKPLDDILPGYSIAIHYSDIKLQTFENANPAKLWALIGIPVVIFAVGFYFFLGLSIREINLSRAKSHFISNVSHELKTPLGLIRLYNETLELNRYSDEKERRGFHRTITRETVRLANIINRLLSFSRMERGQKQYDFKPQNLADVVADILEDYGPQVEDAGFELVRKFDGTIEPLPLDKASISQAVINLLDNAMKYSGNERFISVTVGEDAKGPFVEVADKGIGIPADKINKIFEKFYRVEQSLIHDVKGLGIGLAVVKKIMEDHGGSVEVKSKEGSGSRFTLRFRRDNRTSTVRERTSP